MAEKPKKAKKSRVKKSRVKKPGRLKIEPPSDDHSHPLYLMLGIAVPLWIEKMKGMSDEDALSRAAECSRRIQDAGECVLFRGKKKGKSADAFNAVAEALAVMARCPGGVRFGPNHWDASLAFPHIVGHEHPVG